MPDRLRLYDVPWTICLDPQHGILPYLSLLLTDPRRATILHTEEDAVGARPARAIGFAPVEWRQPGVCLLVYAVVARGCIVFLMFQVGTLHGVSNEILPGMFPALGRQLERNTSIDVYGLGRLHPKVYKVLLDSEETRDTL